MAMRLWARRRKELTSSRTRVANRLHAVISGLVPGGYAGDVYASKGRACSRRPSPPALLLRPARRSQKSGWATFAAYNGSAPIEVSSGPKKIYRLSMKGSRQLNHALNGSVACAAGSHPERPALRPSHSRAKPKARPPRQAARTLGPREDQKKIRKAS